MQRLLIILGLVIIPFYEIFTHILPFVKCVATDSRVTKEELALVFALAIGLLAVWRGEIKPFKNKFFLIIPVYLLVSLGMAPHAPLVINNNEVGDFYFWKPFAEVLCFSLMIIAMASIEIDFNEIIKVMVICGSVMAGYVILQKFGFDQFWMAKGYNFDGLGGVFTNVRAEALGGNLGQPTVVASWLVMMVPLAIYLKKWWQAGLIILSCLFTQGAMVTGALILIGMVYLIKWNVMFLGIFTTIFLICGWQIFTHPSIQNKIIERMDGRYPVWKDTINDIHNGQLPDNIHKTSITGIGFGRFSFVFPSKHKSIFQQTHNDILEFTYNCGLVGGFLLLAGIFLIFKNNWISSSSLYFSVLLSFIGILFCSLGSFPFQLGAHQFYASVLVGLLHNESFKGED